MSVGVAGATITEVAHRHEITRQQIYTWLSELKKKGLLSATANALFIPVDMNAVQTNVGSVGDSYDDQRPLKGRGRRGPWRNFEAVEFDTLEWVDWFDHRRILEPIGNIPPAEAEEQYTPCWTRQPWPHNLNEMASGKPGAVQRYLPNDFETTVGLA